MNIGAVNGVMSLLKQLSDTSKPTVASVAEYSPKPKFVPEREPSGLPRSTPEAQGVSSEALLCLLKEMESDSTLDMHGILILRHGRVILDTAFGDYSTAVWKQTFSACKSVTSIAVGFAVDEGLLSLDEKITDVFRDSTNAVSRLPMRDITIENLLTMTSTVIFAEAEALVSDNWIKSFMSSACKGTAGETFNYNSLNTYMLAAAIVRRSGVSLTEYLTPRLFEPLGIKNIYWEKSPDGIEKGGWGLYITPGDFAKIGQCFLDRGMWEGRRIIPESWIESAAFAKALPPEDFGRFDYGYQMWCGRDTDTFLFNGMLGQNVLGFRDSGVLIVTNAGNNEMFQQSNYFNMVLSRFKKNDLSDEPLPENPNAVQKLSEYCVSLKDGGDASFPEEECEKLDGLELLPESEAPSAGLLPMVLQVMRNNYTKGLSGISFEFKDGKFSVIYKEADALHRIPVGFGKARLCNMNFRGDIFRVAARGAFASNEDGVPVLKLRLSFLETPCTVVLKLFFGRDGVYLVQRETPGQDFSDGYMREIKKGLEEMKIVGGAALLVDDDYLAYKIEKSFSPKIKLIKAEK